MNVSIGSRPDAVAALERVHAVLSVVTPRIVACSGGIDSLVLAVVAHRAAPTVTTIAHTVTPAVPGDGTSRVMRHAEREGWSLEVVRSREFDDERYLSNPTDRCYHCKSNLYDAIAELRSGVRGDAVILSGANVDDLGEYRPGLDAAAERSVRHPYVEAGVAKREVRAIARHLGLAEAELPASPCLASRLYTGTRVTASRLRAVEAGEETVRSMTGIRVVRCRISADGGPNGRSSSSTGDVVTIEVGVDDRGLIDREVLDAVRRSMRTVEPAITDVVLDDQEYRPGRAVLFSS